MQEELFLDDFTDALAHTIKALGGFGAVGAELWPAKPLRSAENWLRDCLNPNRSEKLSMDEVVTILRLARDRGIHTAIYKLCDDAGYGRPAIAPNKTPQQILAEKFQRTAAELSRLADEMAAIDQTAKMRVVK